MTLLWTNVNFAASANSIQRRSYCDILELGSVQCGRGSCGLSVRALLCRWMIVNRRTLSADARSSSSVNVADRSAVPSGTCCKAACRQPPSTMSIARQRRNHRECRGTGCRCTPQGYRIPGTFAQFFCALWHIDFLRLGNFLLTHLRIMHQNTLQEKPFQERKNSKLFCRGEVNSSQIPPLY